MYSVKRSLIAVSTIALSSGLAACGSDATVNPTAVLFDVETPAAATIRATYNLTVGQSVRINPTTTSRTNRLRWSSSNGSVALVSSSGSVSARSVGTSTVTVSGTGVSESYLVNVAPVPAARVTSFSLTPAAGVTLNPGQTQQFATSTTWSDGQLRTSTVTYSATGGTISSTGLYTAGSVAGTFMVIASCACTTPAIADTSFVSVVVPQLTRLTVSPKTASLAAGATQQFAVSAQWSTGATTVPPVTWSASAGSVSASGLYTAPTTAGTYRVIVAHTNGTVRDTATVTVSGGSTNTPTGGGTTTPSGTPFFTDNFDNGARTNANGFQWTSGAAVSVSTERALSGQYALRFEYGAAAPGADSHSEQRFDMGRYIRDVTVEYQLFVPSNFRHRLDDRVMNNKFLMLWRDTYGSFSGTWQIGWEYLRGTDDLNSTARFMSSRWDCDYVTDGCAWPTPAPATDFPMIGSAPNAIKIGQWNKIRFRARGASSNTSQDGVATLWINDVMVFNYTLGRFHNTNASITDAVLRNGYLMGWANSGFAERTVFFIDDVKFWAN